MVSLTDAPPFRPDTFVAEPFLDGARSNIRVIRLGPGQALPPHTHGESDLMLYAVEGEGSLEVADGQVVAFPAGSLAHLDGAEVLRVANGGTVGLTLLAFLAPPFPPRRA